MTSCPNTTFHTHCTLSQHSCIIRIAHYAHIMPHHANCCCTCLLICISEMPMHLTCACVPVLTAAPPPQVRPTDPACREADEMPTATQAVMRLQVQPTAPPCGIINMPAHHRRLSLAVCAQMGLRRACEGGGAAISEGSSSWGASFAQQPQGTTSSLD